MGMSPPEQIEVFLIKNNKKLYIYFFCIFGCKNENFNLTLEVRKPTEEINIDSKRKFLNRENT